MRIDIHWNVVLGSILVGAIASGLTSLILKLFTGEFPSVYVIVALFVGFAGWVRERNS